MLLHKVLAERYNLSSGFFAVQFRKQIGVSPIDYLLRFRIRRATELLLTKRYSVRDAAKAVGYSDPYYFSRMFKKHIGVAPSQISVHTLLASSIHDEPIELPPDCQTTEGCTFKLR
ncbi:helix-turn-helix transcriptional regulator [Paenibacillus albus]|uniref:AraC family transcriptional regulator n=1 Tax=Paenibacillus albus TaxID=2495582 RepID=A0A3Q8XCG0_9BACL|nr:AraC family transcriptional regulator [Paenibacillus albus]